MESSGGHLCITRVMYKCYDKRIGGKLSLLSQVSADCVVLLPQVNGCRFFLGMRFPVIPVKTWVLQFNCLVHSVYMRQCQLIVFWSVNSVSNGMGFE